MDIGAAARAWLRRVAVDGRGIVDWFLDDGDIKLAHGSALDVLAALPAESVQMCVTSPPFYGLRDYGVDEQIGLEETVAAYIEQIVAVFAEVYRVLRSDGTCWVELGDSYVSGQGGRQSAVGELPPVIRRDRPEPKARRDSGLKPKDLYGVPWMVAFALRDAGWYLRSDIVWSRPNPMPESVTDRPTKSHSYVFLLSKSARYYWDADAIREPQSESTLERFKPGAAPRKTGRIGNAASGMQTWSNGKGERNGGGTPNGDVAGRNARSVWSIATQPTPEAHFATYPEELVRRCVLAGSSEAGECSGCGAPWTRQVERTLTPTQRPNGLNPNAPRGPLGDQAANRIADGHQRGVQTVETTGWAASCGCGLPARPQTVLDPFVGSGTTALVARRHGRRAIGIDLNEAYLEIAAKRTAQLSLLAEGPAA